jgi:uncharacterized delta-60 repeat protein
MKYINFLLGLFFTFHVLLPYSAQAQSGSNDASFNPIDSILGKGTGANGSITAMAIQSDGKILIVGAFTTYNGTTRNRIARINTDGTLDTGFDPGTGAGSTISAIAIQSDGKILIGGAFTTYNGTTRNRIARIHTDGSLDTGFDPGTGASNIGQINAMAIQSDGKILIGGQFTAYNGTARNRIARINTDGSLDTGFNPAPATGADNTINAISIQSDGKILIGGQFTTYNGTSRNRIVRINTDGTLDTGFDPATGADNTISAFAILSDGKILIAGWFTTYNGTARNRIARINTDGTLDTGFDPGTGAGSSMSSMAIQSDGKILIGGNFTSYNGITRNRIARINSNGSLDSEFDRGRGADNSINAMAIQSDGKIVIGGNFTTYNGTASIRIARINSDGSLDSGFDPGLGADGIIYAIAIQSDGKILIGGSFTTYNGTTRNRIARINSDGSLDTGFDPGTGADAPIYAIAIQSDGKILIGGNFTSYNGTTRTRIARINSDGSLDTGFDSGGAGVNSSINAIAIQSDGKILIVGGFTSYQGTTRNRIARINSDGSYDTGFDSGTASNGNISVIAIQSDGKILIGGGLTAYNGTARNRIARINSDGSLDTGFDPGTGATATIGTMAIQSDGKILIGGSFTAYNGTTRNRIARINTDGSLDTGFDPGTGAPATISTMAIQSDGKVVIGGTFTSYNGITRTRIARILNCTAPTVSANSSSSSICIGASATLSGTGASTYAWQPGNLTGSPSVSPSSTTTYTVTGTDANGCSNTGTYQITVNALPSVGINSSASTICNGASASLSGTGATTYAWQPGNLTGSPVVSPTSNTTYTVVGTDANGCTNSSTTLISIYAPGNPLCTQPTCGMPTSISATPTYNSVVINFTKALSANTTFIQTRVKGTANWGGSSITGQSLTINYLIPSTVYEYRLRSSCTGAASLFTSISEFTTPVYVAPLPNCNAPTNINATVTGANSVTLTWTASVGAQQYFVQYKPSTSSWANSFGSTAFSTTKTFTNLVPNTTYNYRVRTTCVTGQTMNPGSTFSSINNFTTLPGASSALFNVNESAWSIYPNPTHDLVQLEFTSSVEEALTIMVFDMTGRLVQSVVTQSLKGNNQIDISLGTLSNGMYIIKSRQGNAVTTLGKVTKN